MSFPLGNGFAVVAGHAFMAAKICKKFNILNLDYPGAAFIELLTKNILKSLGQESKFTGKHIKIPLEVGGDLAPAAAEVTSGADCVISGLGEANWAAFLPAAPADWLEGPVLRCPGQPRRQGRGPVTRS